MLGSWVAYSFLDEWSRIPLAKATTRNTASLRRSMPPKVEIFEAFARIHLTAKVFARQREICVAHFLSFVGNDFSRRLGDRMLASAHASAKRL